jgi:hypothetical protein
MRRGQQTLFGTESGADDTGMIADAMDRAIRSVAQRCAEFTTDEVADQLSDWNIAEPRQLGPAMLRALTAGSIAPTDRVRPTTNPKAHQRPKAIWKSQLCGGSR